MITYRGERIEVWDAHAHVGVRQEMGIKHAVEIMSFLPEQLIPEMDAAGVDVVTPFPIGVGVKSDYADQNRLIAQAMQDHPGRIIGYARLNPHFGFEHNRALLEEAVRMGLRGLKLHPLIECFAADDPHMVYPLIELAEHHHLPVIFHCGMGEDASPDRIARVARDFPRVDVIAGHSGLTEGLQHVVQHAKRLPNLYMDTSAVGWVSVLCDAILWAGPERVLYGSDTPFNPMKMELDKVAVYANAHLQLSVADLRMVLGGNLRRLLRVA